MTENNLYQYVNVNIDFTQAASHWYKSLLYKHIGLKLVIVICVCCPPSVVLATHRPVLPAPPWVLARRHTGYLTRHRDWPRPGWGGGVGERWGFSGGEKRG